MLSTAKSSSSVPTTVSSGSASTRNCALSGMAPPDVIAARRAPRLPRTTPCTRSRWRNAPLRPALGADAFGQHVDDRVEIAARHIGVAIGASNQREEVVLRPVLGSGHRDDLLRQHVERRLGDQQLIELALRNRSDERRAFDQLIACGREDASFGLGRVLDLMAGAADALQRNGDRSRRADLADEIDRADVDAELERCRRHHRLELSASSASPPRSAAACATGCRDAQAPRLRPAVRPDCGRRARPAAWC